MKESKNYFKQAISLLITVCLIVGIANIPAYAGATAISATKTTDAILSEPYYTPAQLTKETELLKVSSSEKISVENENIKGVQQGKDSNGQTKYYAVISYGEKDINVEIPNNLYQYIANNKISKESVTVTINEAETKGNINGNGVISSTDAQITINIAAEAINTLAEQQKQNNTEIITVENPKVDTTKNLTATTIGSSIVTKGTLEYTMSYIKSLANKSLNLINKLLKNKKTSSLSKTWLKKAKSLINSVVKGKKKSTEKVNWLKKALTSIKAVSKAGASIISLTQQTNASSSVFSSLKSVLKKNLTYKMYSKYSIKGITVIKAVAKRFGVKTKNAYNIFVKMGVTKAQVKEAGSAVVSVIKRGLRLDNCGSLAVARYLKISVKSAALQNFVAEIATCTTDFVRRLNKSKGIVATSFDAIGQVLRKNGNKYVETVTISKKDFLNMKKGQKAVVTALCLRGDTPVTSHGITIERQKDGKFAVYDILMNGGNKVIYTKTEFIKFMNGKRAKGKTASGRTIIKPVYLNSAAGPIRYMLFQFGTTVIASTDSRKFIGTDVKKAAKTSISLINKMLKKKNLNSVAKTWLTKAKALITKVKNSYKKNSDRFHWVVKALISISEVSKSNVSMQSLAKASTKWNSPFTSLKSVLKNDTTYKIYTKYGEEGLDIINKISKKCNISATAIYNGFLKNGVGLTNLMYFNETEFNNIVDKIEQEKVFFAKATEDTSLNEITDHYKNFEKQLGALKNSTIGKTVADLANFNIAYNESLEKNISYKIYTKYGAAGADVINGISQKYNLSQTETYNQFLNNGVTREEMDYIASHILRNLNGGGNFFNWRYRYTSINNALAAIEKIVNNNI